MFDLGSYEFLLMVLVALIVIGPKDLPNVLRFVGRWAGKARGVVAQFRLGIDDMVRETELKDMEKKWQAENDRIMREFPEDPMADVGKSKPSGASKPADTPQVSDDQSGVSDAGESSTVQPAEPDQTAHANFDADTDDKESTS